MAAFCGERLEDGRARLVRHGHLPEREVMTGIGPVPVKVPRVRDRFTGDDKITFTPSILPRYLRKAKSVEELLPWLYLKGVSTGDFTEALEALLGPNAKGLSAKTVTRLKADWWTDYEAWQKRDLGTRRFLYIWADGVYFKPRMSEEKQCVLVIVGADEYGRKELLAMTDGFRESTQSWREVLLDLKRRGLKQDPKLAIGDGALGFWTALREVFATTREQRCWVHKTMNVLNALPTFYDYPAEHWKHIRTSNPIESTFATVRHRTKRTKGYLSRKTGLALLGDASITCQAVHGVQVDGPSRDIASQYPVRQRSAQKKWRKLDGQNRLPEIIQGVEFRDGLRQFQTAA
jgi:transposase-like protein